MATTYFYFTNSSAANLLEDNATLLTDLYCVASRTNRPTSRVKAYIAILNILFNCSRLLPTTISDKRLVLTLDKKFFSSEQIICGSGCKIPISYRTFVSVLDYLESEGYIVLERGGQFIYKEHVDSHGEIKKISTGKRKSSVMIPTEMIYKYCIPLNTPLPENVLILKDENKKPMKFILDGELEMQVKMLNAYNSKIDTKRITNADGETIDEPFLKRIYNKDFNHGGRFYTIKGAIQNMSSKERSMIMIDGKPCVEIDVKALHPAICYTEVNEKMPEDPYEFTVKCQFDQEEADAFVSRHDIDGSYSPLRNLKKIIMLCAFNSDNEIDLVFTVAKKLGDDVRLKGTSNEANRKFVGISNVAVKEAITAMKIKHFKIGDYFHSNKSTLLQYKDSTFMAEVLTQCLQRDIVVAPIHDSVICQHDKVEEVKEIMAKSFKKVFGSLVNYRVSVK